MHHSNDLVVTEDNVEYARLVSSVGGNLKVLTDDAGLGALIRVEGDVKVHAKNAGLNALASVGGSLSVTAAKIGTGEQIRFESDLKVQAKNAGLTSLTSVGRDLYINAEDAGLTALTSVGGNLKARGKNMGLTALTSVEGNVLVVADNADLGALIYVGGNLVIYGDGAGLTALTTIGGGLYIYAKDPGLTSLASLGGRVFVAPTHEIAAARLKAVAKAALATPGALNMAFCHYDTSHSIAGWAIHLAGEEGYALEKAVGEANAGAMLLGLPAAEVFFRDKKAARARLLSALHT